MFIKLGSLNVHYKVAGHGEPLILIHGWGCSGELFTRLQQHLARRFTVYAIDLPGFGLSTKPETIWGSAEYAKLVEQFIIATQTNHSILIGHSLGGKIIINLVARHLVEVKKIILISSAGIKLPRSFKLNLKIWFFKLIKFLASFPGIKSLLGWRLELYKKRFGSDDYRESSGLMRSILVKIINEDLTAFLVQITVPTLLLWGDQDTSTPLKAGQIMQNLIQGAKLTVFSGSGHFPFIDAYEKVVMEIDSFLD